MSEQNWGCLDKMSEVNFSPAETQDMLLTGLFFKLGHRSSSSDPIMVRDTSSSQDASSHQIRDS